MAKNRKNSYEVLQGSKDYKKYFKSAPNKHKAYEKEFIEDVSVSPTRHDANTNKIVKLRGSNNPPEAYRWKKADLRICYAVSHEKKLVFPYEANTAASVSYKKKK